MRRRKRRTTLQVNRSAEADVLRWLRPLVRGRRHWVLIMALPALQATALVGMAPLAMGEGDLVGLIPGPRPGWAIAVLLTPKSGTTPRRFAEQLGDLGLGLDRLEEELAGPKDVVFMVPKHMTPAVKQLVQEWFGEEACDV